MILSSPAVRALTTAQLFAEPLNYKAEKIQQCAEIYEAGVSTLLKTINEIDDRNNCVVMFGHNPGLTDLFNYLTDNDLINLPTSGIVKIDFDLDSWKLVSHGIGISTYIDYPKKV